MRQISDAAVIERKTTVGDLHSMADGLCDRVKQNIDVPENKPKFFRGALIKPRR